MQLRRRVRGELARRHRLACTARGPQHKAGFPDGAMTHPTGRLWTMFRTPMRVGSSPPPLAHQCQTPTSVPTRVSFPLSETPSLPFHRTCSSAPFGSSAPSGFIAAVDVRLG